MAIASSSNLTANATARLSGWLRHLGVSPMAFDDTVSLLNPLLAVHHLRARVVARQAETPSATTFVLQAGPAFAGLRAGQHLIVGVTIGGVRHRRAYSPRAIEGQPGRFAITVQRQPEGLVSGHLHEQVRVGQVLDIEQARGDFTLPSPTPPQVLLIAGGSGITPGIAMLEQLQRQARSTRVTLIYFARSEADRIFAEALNRLATSWPSFRYLPIDSVAHTNVAGAPAAPQVLDRALLDGALPQWAQVPTFCCGPAPLMDAARTLWQAAGASAQLHLEAFAVARPNGDPLARHAVHILRESVPRQFIAPGNETLLVAGEVAGLALKHGCRQGICHECTCRLHSGSVRDLQSGQRIDGEGQPIRLCVTSAMSDLHLESLN
ncbi:ferredoxin reductase [Aquabacterium sp.]|uniref:ferredoxin reductase n=1 Tax=Aquabacterium sp. TaxID=1872578 RepID=UPI0025B98449|nr:ferredoxin reductase [Aquabacterium sp.]